MIGASLDLLSDLPSDPLSDPLSDLSSDTPATGRYVTPPPSREVIANQRVRLFRELPWEYCMVCDEDQASPPSLSPNAKCHPPNNCTHPSIPDACPPRQHLVRYEEVMYPKMGEVTGFAAPCGDKGLILAQSLRGVSTGERKVTKLPMYCTYLVSDSSSIRLPV